MTYNEIIARLPWTREQMPKQEYLVWVASRKQAGEGINVETCEIGCWVAEYVYLMARGPRTMNMMYTTESLTLCAAPIAMVGSAKVICRCLRWNCSMSASLA